MTAEKYLYRVLEGAAVVTLDTAVAGSVLKEAVVAPDYPVTTIE